MRVMSMQTSVSVMVSDSWLGLNGTGGKDGSCGGPWAGVITSKTQL